jgi:hypothetical protein
MKTVVTDMPGPNHCNQASYTTVINFSIPEYYFVLIHTPDKSGLNGVERFV